MSEVQVGDRLLVAIHPDSNAGVDHAAATITQVNADGTVNLTAHLNGGGEKTLTDVTVYPSRGAFDEDLEEHFGLLPGNAKDDSGRWTGGKNRHNDNQPWERADVHAWVTGAWRQPIDGGGATPVKANSDAVSVAQADVDGRDAYIAELERQLARRPAAKRPGRKPGPKKAAPASAAATDS